MAAAAENPLEAVPPHDENAEAGVLGAMLADERAAGVAVEMLVFGDFYLPRHQLLFKLFAELYEQQPDLDEVFVQSELRKRGLDERVGGKEIVGRLFDAVPTPANVERYCRIVRERALERELIASAGQIVQMCRQPEAGEGSASLVNRAEELIYRIADRRASNEPVSILNILEGVLGEAERQVQARRDGREIKSPALPTGFADLDRKCAGGLWPGELCIIAARPSVGKTTLSLNIARHVANRPPEHHPVPVGIFSLEMPKEQLSKNLLCSEAQISSSKMRTYQFDEEDYVTVKHAAHTLKQAPIFIDDAPHLTPSELRARARRLRHREGVRLFIIDYLQLMTTTRRHENRVLEVAALTRQIKQLARELEVPIVLLSQLRRPPQGEENKKPALTDLRESGAIEQDADVVVMLHRELDENNVMTAQTRAIVQKNRNGETGEIRLTFRPECFRFDDYVPEPEFEEADSAVGVGS